MSVYTVRQISVPGGGSVQMSSDLAVPPACSIVGGSEQNIVATLNFNSSGGLILTGTSGTLPTADPHFVGQVWDNGGLLAISNG